MASEDYDSWFPTEIAKDTSDVFRIYLKRAKARAISSTTKEAKRDPLAYKMAFSFSGNDLLKKIGQVIDIEAKNDQEQESNDDVTFI